MADWNQPLLSSLYADVLDHLKNRDLDAAKMFSALPTNPAANMFRYNRTDNVFEEYDGAAWQDKILALTGGGTGASSASGARTNLGLGTLATQNANGVAITGGTITGLAALTTAGNVTFGGTLTVGSSGITLTTPAGKIGGLTSSYFNDLNGGSITGLNGSNITGGTVAAARLGSGSPSSTNFLRGDNTWQEVSAVVSVQKVEGTFLQSGGAEQNFTISPALSDWTKAAITSFTSNPNNNVGEATITSNSNLRIRGDQTNNATFTCYIVVYRV